MCSSEPGAVDNAEIETPSFESWDDAGRHCGVLVAPSSWHWVDRAIGRHRAHGVLRPRALMAVLENTVVRRPGEPEV